MTSIWLIARRELRATVLSPLGFIVAALALLLIGLFFNASAMEGNKLSTQVLAGFFEILSGVSMVASVFIAMRLFAEERQTKTISLLLAAPVKDTQVVLGKFLGGFLFLSILILLSVYIPLLILIHGKISLGHIVAGYLGTLLLGAASMSIGTFCSALAKSQIIALMTGSVIMATSVILWMLGRVTDAPFNDLFPYMALHNIHFRPFMNGKIHLRDLVYYLSVSAFFLAAATRMLESRRWR
jgi:ABC-2 type transport system permease protein